MQSWHCEGQQERGKDTSKGETIRKYPSLKAHEFGLRGHYRQCCGDQKRRNMWQEQDVRRRLELAGMGVWK